MKQSAFSVILIFVCLTLAGLALVPLLPVKLSPSQTLPQISVYFNLPNNASRVVEMEATSKLEAMLARIKGVENISSTSGNGWGIIYIRFDKHVNMDAARFEVSTIIRQTWPFLPQGMSYPSISLSRSDNNANRPFLSYTVNAPANPIVIQRYTENNIQPKLAQIAGVNRIGVSGAMPLEWRLEYDYKQLETVGLSVQDIQSAINNYLNKEFLGIASVSSPDKEEGGEKAQWLRIALVPKNTGQNEFNPANIGVKNKGGKLISLDQLVTTSRMEQEARSYYRINGLNSIYLSITSEENANQLELSRKIKDKLKEIESLFPAGYEIHLSYDATEYIQNELEKVYFRSGLTLLILLFFVLIIYRSFKYLFLIFLSLFMNIAIAVIFYYFGGLEMQLYSLAGITISLTLVIDNTIVMADQIVRRHNKKAFPAILAATVTTIASLVIIFFMDEKIRLNLQDFAKVIIINLSVSLFIALFLAPALIEKLRIHKKGTRYTVHGAGCRVHGKRFRLLHRAPCTVHPISFPRLYAAFCRFIWRWRVPVCIFIVLAFGLPVFLLPEKVEGEGRWPKLYNQTLGSTFYKEKIKPHTDVWLGGTLRLFAQKVFEGSYFSDRQETSIYMTATLPNGSTVAQMNNLIQRMESYISQFPEIRQFQTNIQNARRADINIQFTKASERTGFPYTLKSKLISKSIELGGGSWGVYGLGDGFSNDVRESAGSYQVILRGFNYDELSEWTGKFKSLLLEHRRIKEVTIGSEFSWYKDDYQEFIFDLKHERLAQENIQPVQLFASLKPMFGQEIYAGQLPGEYGLEQMVLHSRQSKEYDIWSLEHVPGKTGDDKEYKLMELASLEKTQAPQNIVKENQQYRLCLQYEYIGANAQGRKVLERNIDEFKKILPIGYSIENQERSWNWGKDNSKQYGLLLLIFVIVYFMCSILFNSLKQPFSVIFVIPIAFIGIFLTFYLFKLNFDQGGFASFILLCGLSVNANIYILNEYNNILKKRKIPPLQAYIKAWNAKIVPIFLTVISTILGFIPFMIGDSKEAFWFPLAAGTIGGLIVSLLGTFCFLPLFMGVANFKMKSSPSITGVAVLVLSLTMICTACSPKGKQMVLPTTDYHYRKVQYYIEDEPDADYRHASEAAHEAFRDIKFAVRIHWGIYSIWEMDGESWGFLNLSNEKKQEYNNLYKSFNPTDFDAQEWMDLFKRSGIKAFAFTTKHHEGFSMFHTKTRVKQRANYLDTLHIIEPCDLAYSIEETPFKRDIVKELCDAAHRNQIKIDLYFSHPDWYDADFRPYNNHPLTTAHYQTFDGDYGFDPGQCEFAAITPDLSEEEKERLLARHREQLRELLTNYGKIDLLCFDQWMGRDIWPQMKETIKMIRKLQPDVMLRCRGIGNYGDYYTPEGFVPGDKENTTMPWMTIYPLANSFSYDKTDKNYKGAPWIIHNIIDCAAKGGSFMVGIGPNGTGRFHPKAIEQLEETGRWLEVNGEGIYATRECDVWKENDIYFTRTKDHRKVFAFVEKWPGKELFVPSVHPKMGSKVFLLGYKEPLKWTATDAGMKIEIPEALQSPENRPCEHAWGFRIRN